MSVQVFPEPYSMKLSHGTRKINLFSIVKTDKNRIPSIFAPASAQSGLMQVHLFSMSRLRRSYIVRTHRPAGASLFLCSGHCAPTLSEHIALRVQVNFFVSGAALLHCRIIPWCRSNLLLLSRPRCSYIVRTHRPAGASQFLCSGTVLLHCLKIS